MNIIERVLTIVAPHSCLGCAAEGSLLCEWCRPDACPPLPERCYRCKKATLESLVCPNCRQISRIKHVWVATDYDGVAKRLVHALKFERAQAAAGVMTEFMIENLPYISPEVLVVHIPAASSRVRQRGYDQAELLASALAAQLGLRHVSLLSRLTQTRQVGAKRTDRLMQLAGAFRSSKPYLIKDAHVLLVDDVVTTGATLEEAAKTLKRAGARTVDAVVFAQTQ